MKMSISEVRQQGVYLTKVATLAQVFDWPSVLNFDTAFRRDRHAANKNWETDNNYLMQAYLRQKSSGNEARTAASLSGNSRAGDKTDPRTGKPICKRFNSQKDCGFHACSTCFSTNHGETRHVTKKRIVSFVHSSPLHMKLQTWKEEMCDDPDKEFIISGITEGFSLVDENKL
ncbi:hypothetical protein BaRGS_00011266 [Batillaria attramentaria]|uniref:C2H2-type domain-containing protein n=1 Tax=Batillaria attramentaria TaxID=370345 RepID=A0ABD0LEI3_9CAEN